MSLLINDKWSDTRIYLEDDAVEDQHDLNRLDRYLAIMETNKKSSKFIPDDALLALDMAGFVRGRLSGKSVDAPVSAARLALALVQGQNSPPLQ